MKKTVWVFIVAVFLVSVIAVSGSYSSVWADPQQGGQRNGLSKEKPAIDRVVVPKSSLPFATQAGTVAQWTNNGTCSSGQGTWINNSWIVYINWCDDALYKTDGVQNIMLSDPLDEYYCDSHPDVNKTGTLIAFQRNMYNQVGDYCSALWIMDINGGNQQQVIPCAPNVGGAHEPKWSPDGKYIAYTQGFEDHDYKELYVVGFPATIKLPTRLTFNANYPHHNLQWLTTSVGWSALRNGSYILGSFRNEDPINGRTRNVAKVNTSTAAVTWLTDRTDAYCEQTPYPTTTGKVLFMSDIGGYGDIYIMNNDGTNKKQLTNTAVDGYCSNHPVPHPNGKYVAYWSEYGDGEFRVWMMTIDGKYKGIVVDEPTLHSYSYRENLAFNPAGTKLVFSMYDVNWYINQYVLTLDTADPDGDTLKNYEEVIYGTNIAAKDTDGGGENDYSEVNAGRDPLNPADDVVRAW